MSKTTRLLSLILVIAMAFSLFAVSGSAKWAQDAAEYSDYAAFDYKEAAKVLAYLNIFEGAGEDSFGVEKTLQRDAAIKIVALVVTAANDKTADDETKNFTATATKFEDVPKTQWASGYIQWGVNNNVVNGKGFVDGKEYYKPLESVTVLQFLKMLLTGLGYGANGEFAGTGWDSAVYVKATELGLWGAIDPVVVDREATKGEAMEFALQALKKAPVHYAFNAYAQGSLLNVNSYDTRPLYKRHGLELDRGVDKIGYKTYRWVEAKNNALVYEGYEDIYRTVLITPDTKASELQNGIIGDADELELWINGYDQKSATGSVIPEFTIQAVDKDGNYTSDTSKITGFSVIPSGVGRNETFAKNLHSVLGGTIGAKVSLYVEDRKLSHVTVEIQFVAEVSNVNETAKTYTATVANKYVGSAYKNAGFSYTLVDLNGAEYKNKQIITIVPQFNSMTTVSLVNTGAYPKAVLKSYETKTATGYSGYTTLVPMALKFGANKHYGSQTWGGSSNAGTVPTMISGNTISTALFYTDSNGFLVRIDEVAAALPVRYAVAKNIYLVQTRTEATGAVAGEFPAVYDYSTALFGGEYQAIGNQFEFRNGAWTIEYASNLSSGFFGSPKYGLVYGASTKWVPTLVGYFGGDNAYWGYTLTALGGTTAYYTPAVSDWEIGSIRSTGSIVRVNNGDWWDADAAAAKAWNDTYQKDWQIASDCVVLINGYNGEGWKQYNYNTIATQEILYAFPNSSSWADGKFYLNSDKKIGAIVLDTPLNAPARYDTFLTKTSSVEAKEAVLAQAETYTFTFSNKPAVVNNSIQITGTPRNAAIDKLVLDILYTDDDGIESAGVKSGIDSDAYNGYEDTGIFDKDDDKAFLMRKDVTGAHYYTLFINVKVRSTVQNQRGLIDTALAEIIADLGVSGYTQTDKTLSNGGYEISLVASATGARPDSTVYAITGGTTGILESIDNVKGHDAEARIPSSSTYTVNLSETLVAGDILTVTYEAKDAKSRFSYTLTVTAEDVGNLGWLSGTSTAQQTALATEIVKILKNETTLGTWKENWTEASTFVGVGTGYWAATATSVGNEITITDTNVPTYTESYLGKLIGDVTFVPVLG